MKVALYVQIQPARTRWNQDRLDGTASHVHITKRKPKAVLADHRLFVLNLDIPLEHFETPLVEITADKLRPVTA